VIANWAVNAHWVSRTTNQGAQIQNGPVRGARVAASADDLCGQSLQTAIVSVVGHPVATEGTPDNANKVDVNHRERRVRGANGYRPRDVLTDTGTFAPGKFGLGYKALSKCSQSGGAAALQADLA
jgi:hypothetical protein